MSDLVASLFEQELKRCGVPCRFDDETQRYRVQNQGRNLARAADNLLRVYVGEQS